MIVFRIVVLLGAALRAVNRISAPDHVGVVLRVFRRSLASSAMRCVVRVVLRVGLVMTLVFSTGGVGSAASTFALTSTALHYTRVLVLASCSAILLTR